MKTLLKISGICAALLAAFPCTASVSSTHGGIVPALAEFRNPQDSTRTKVWWFHGETETTREGITADLEAYKEAGIGGVVYYDQVHGSAENALPALSEGWWEMLKFAASEAQRIGLSFEIALSNGYVAGGPWISKDMSMQRLCSSSTLVSGGRVDVTLQVPTSDDWHSDVAVLAFPAAHEAWRDIPLDSPVEFEKPFTARSVTYTAPKSRKSRNGAMNYPDGPAEKFYGMMYVWADDAGVLEASDDGISWREVCSLPTPEGASGVAERTLSFPPVTARHFRIRTDVKISGAALSSRSQTPRWQIKAARFSDFPIDEPAMEGLAGVLDSSRMVDLTGLMSSDGHLVWDAPDGNWVVMRFAAESTKGAVKHGRPEMKGLECDKMSRAAVRLHWNSYAGRILDTLSRAGLNVDGVIMDSHEAGPQNWTADFPAVFKAHNGYDILPWLPAMTGSIVGSPSETEKFLTDLRRTIADTVTDNYYGELQRLCTEAGVDFTAQATGNGLSLVADNIMAKKAVQKPQGEFWARDVNGSYDIIDCASAAHVYGKPIASAEAFTDAKFSDSPAKLKMLADFAYASLLNEFVICASAYQSKLDEVPGNVANGRQYCLNRNNTIWKYSRPLWDYQARCAGMLRKGDPVVDVLVFLGDDPPVKTLAHKLPLLSEGYNFDSVSGDALKGASVSDGELVLESGMRYRMLIVERETVVPDWLRALIDSWKANGLEVVESPGIYEEVHPSFAPDFAFHSARKLTDCVRFGHRRLQDADVYFVYNHSSSAFLQQTALRSDYKRLFFLDPVTGDCLAMPGTPQSFLLNLAPDQSCFLVATDASLPGSSVPSGDIAETVLSGGWNVRFDSSMGGPATIRINPVQDWTESADNGVKYYSGTAKYSGRFNLRKPRGSSRVFLHFDGLEWMAKVKVNGQDAGTVWCSPWELDITPYLKNGRNSLELEITNSLYNRMIGDAVLGEHYTKSSFPLVTSEDPLLPSGITGPVRLVFR